MLNNKETNRLKIIGKTKRYILKFVMITTEEMIRKHRNNQ